MPLENISLIIMVHIIIAANVLKSYTDSIIETYELIKNDFCDHYQQVKLGNSVMNESQKISDGVAQGTVIV